jgi:hypothetical protein
MTIHKYRGETMDKQENDVQVKINMATGRLKMIIDMASGKEYDMLPDAQRLKLIADTAQSVLDVLMETKPDTSWDKPIDGPDRPSQ